MSFEGTPTLKLILMAGAASAIALSAAYYLLQGYHAFQGELGDFVPTPDKPGVSAETLIPSAEIVFWTLREGARQRAFYVPPRNGCVIVYTHGAPGDASGFQPLISAMENRGFGALAIDLPGYGGSEGERNWRESYVETIRSGIDFLVEKGVGSQCIGGFGYSMGTHSITAAAVQDERLRALVLLAGYTNLTQQLQHQFRRRVPGMGYFAALAAYWRGVAVHNMDTQALLSKLGDTPVYVIQGSEDYVIPQEMAEMLAATAKNSELWIINGATHIDHAEVAGATYYQRIAAFWQKTLLTGH